MTQAILPAFIVAGTVDAGFSREHALLRPGSPIPATTSSVNVLLDTRAGGRKLTSMKISIQSLAMVALTVIGFALSPKAQAVSPPPDGSYSGGNTAEGQDALLSLGTGAFNTAVGFFSLRSDSTNSFNTAIGAGALLANTADQNTAAGAGALLNNTSGDVNTANGAFALFSNTGGAGNTATGVWALFSNSTGFFNTAVGSYALRDNIGDANTAVGFSALPNNTTGVGNTAVGDSALDSNTTGSGNTALGADAGVGVSIANSVICIGTAGADVDNSCFIGHIRDVQTANADAIPVLIDSVGQLGTASSSAKFKKEIQPMGTASEAILALKPVTFHYKSDKTNTPQFGLIAEEVAQTNPDLVVRDKNGDIYTVRYDAVNAMLLNEFLKEHRRVEELKSAMAQQRKDFETVIARQQKTTEALVTRLNEQEARIQKVSAQVEMRKSGSQMLVENQ